MSETATLKPGDRVRLNAVGRMLATSKPRKFRHGTLARWHRLELNQTAWVRWDGLAKDQNVLTRCLEPA